MYPDFSYGVCSDVVTLFMTYPATKTYLYYKRDGVTVDVGSLPKLVIDVVLRNGVHAVYWVVPRSNDASLVISIGNRVYRFDFYGTWSLDIDIARVVCPRIVKVDVDGRKLTIAGSNVLVIPLSKVAGYLFTRIFKLEKRCSFN